MSDIGISVSTQYDEGLRKVSGDVQTLEERSDEAGGRFKVMGLTLSDVYGGLQVVKQGAEMLGQALQDVIGPSAELQTSMTQIAALTDTPRAAIDGLTKDVLALARDLPIGANALAKGLYFISSSGFQGAEAMEILGVTSRAAAAGLGETQTIADAVTSALNAYKLEGADAARITDILTQAVKEGKGEPDQLAGSLGRVLPIAAAAGVSMEQVAASMATMTRTGLTADESATALRGTLGALLAPSKQSRDALAEIGLTVEDVANKLRGDGLVSLLKLLMERTKGNVEVLDAIIPNIRALIGVLSTAGSQGDDYAEILLKMQNAAGTTDKAFTEMSNTLEFKIKKAQNSLENLGIAVNSKLLPPLSDAADAAALLITWQDRLLEAEVATEIKVRESAKSWDEYANTMIGVTRAEEERTLLQRDMERGLLDQTEYEKELAAVISGVTRAQFEEGRMLKELTADLGDIGAYTTQVEANQSVEFQAIASEKQLKAEAKATKEMLDAAAEATIENSRFAESFKQFDAAQGAKMTIADLEEAIKANPENRENYAAQIRAIKMEFGLVTPAMEAASGSFRILEGLWQSGDLSTTSYATALGKIQQAARDGAVSVDELGLKTSEAAAYMTASTTSAAGEQERIVNDARTRKEKLMDEMGNALAGQQTKLQGKISDSMLAVSNSLTTAKSLANTVVDEIKAAWDRVPSNVYTDYWIRQHGQVTEGGEMPTRAGGGDVMAGWPYWVGEEGPEPYVPAVNGRILSRTDAMSALRGGGGDMSQIAGALNAMAAAIQGLQRGGDLYLTTGPVLDEHTIDLLSEMILRNIQARQ